MDFVIRNHYEKFLEAAKKYDVTPAEEDATVSLKDKEYNEGLIKYDEEIHTSTDPVWEKHYLGSK